MPRFEHLDGYEFSGCAVRTRNIISFFGTRWENKDALEIRTTGIFYYYQDEPPEKRWAYREIGMTTGIHGAAVFRPKEQWVFVMDDGEVFVAGGGESGQERITAEKPVFFRNVRTVHRGYAFAVGPGRRVFRRDGKNRWTKLDRGLSSKPSGSDMGFADIDGFSDTEIYACGGEGDLWTFDGAVWSQIDLPTNAALERLCCGGDGNVYVLTDQKSFLTGRGQTWRILEQDVTQNVLEQMVWYTDRVIVSSGNTLFEILNGVFQTLSLPPVKQKSCKNLASGDGVLIVAGGNEASMYDGARWTVILPAP